MKRALILGFLLVGASAPFAMAQNPPRAPRVAPGRTTPARAVPNDAAPSDAQPAQTPPPAGVCCCRVWSHGWQYSWRPAPECTTQNGTCVTPDHC
jgi:hypothetical protein